MAAVDEGEEEEETEPSQLSPVFTRDGEISNEEFELSFLATIPALGLMTYYIRELKSDDGPNDEMTVAKVKIFNSKSQPFQVFYCFPFRFLRKLCLLVFLRKSNISIIQVAPFDSVKLSDTGAKFALSNAHVVAEFDGSGLLQAVTTLQDKVKTSVQLEFVEYGTTRKADKSGAYLFMPGGILNFSESHSLVIDNFLPNFPRLRWTGKTEGVDQAASPDSRRSPEVLRDSHRGLDQAHGLPPQQPRGGRHRADDRERHRPDLEHDEQPGNCDENQLRREVGRCFLYRFKRIPGPDTFA